MKTLRPEALTLDFKHAHPFLPTEAGLANRRTRKRRDQRDTRTQKPENGKQSARVGVRPRRADGLRSETSGRTDGRCFSGVFPPMVNPALLEPRGSYAPGPCNNDTRAGPQKQPRLFEKQTTQLWESKRKTTPKPIKSLSTPPAGNKQVNPQAWLARRCLPCYPCKSVNLQPLCTLVSACKPRTASGNSYELSFPCKM